MEPDKCWTNKYKVHSFLCNNLGKIRVSSIAKLLQESAWEHAEHCGAGYHTLKPYGLVWILHGLKIEISAYPTWGDHLSLETWGKNYETLFAYRDFEIRNQGNETPVIKASSSWLLVNAESHRPQRIEGKLQKIPVNQRDALNSRPGEIVLPGELKSFYMHKVVHSDIDIYDHVNNTSYIQFCVDAVTGSKDSIDQIKSFEIKFIQESKLGEELKIEYTRQGDNFYFQARNNLNQKEIFRAQATLKR
ncbi:MAG: hypothetical protein IH594_18375 [Bacteroidales bacterium]|nr:hypothetical protein [Bacteroidales bacterium]